MSVKPSEEFISYRIFSNLVDFYINSFIVIYYTCFMFRTHIIIQYIYVVIQ